MDTITKRMKNSEWTQTRRGRRTSSERTQYKEDEE
jgi:hypothetical protein